MGVSLVQGIKNPAGGGVIDSASVVKPATLSTSTSRIRIGVSVGRVVIPLSSVGRRAVMGLNVSAITAVVAPYPSLREAIGCESSNAGKGSCCGYSQVAQ